MEPIAAPAPPANVGQNAQQVLPVTPANQTRETNLSNAKKSKTKKVNAAERKSPAVCTFLVLESHVWPIICEHLPRFARRAICEKDARV